MKKEYEIVSQAVTLLNTLSIFNILCSHNIDTLTKSKIDQEIRCE